MSYYGWRPYVPVAARRAKARKELEKLRKKGKNIYPVEIEGRAIARSFWGKGWCQHLESFSDYANRLPRGRTYARNGSVCHLDVLSRRIEAMVSGSSLYTVTIEIEPLSASHWKEIKKACAGRIGSMLELLQGKLSKEVMAIVADRNTGLFPKPNEIKLHCSCPDWATMCKHVAAVLYGVGNRLDLHPELLFLLRNVEAKDLIAAELAVLPTGATASQDDLDSEDLGAIFGVEIEGEYTSAELAIQEAPTTYAIKPKTTKRSKDRAKKSATKPRVTKGKKIAKNNEDATPLTYPEITGPWIKELRERCGDTAPQFAARLGVSSPSIYRWEGISGAIKLQQRTQLQVHDLWSKTQKPKRSKRPGKKSMPNGSG